MTKGARPAEYHSEERLEREAKAVAAVLDGSSVVKAAEAYGIPRSTLQNRVAWLMGDGRVGREERIQEAEEQILDLTLVSVEAAQRLLAERAVSGELTTKEAVSVAGMGQDKLALRRRWGKESHSEGQGGHALAKALESMASKGGGKLTIEVEPEQEAIDVTPEKT